MAMELLGILGMTPELKQTYDRILLSVAEQYLQFANYGEKRNIPARGGKSIEFRKFEKLAVGTHVLTEGTPPTEIQATISTVAATISQYGAYAKISDVLETQAFDPIIEEYTRKFGIHMAEVLDTVVRDALSAGLTTVQYAGAATVVGTSGAGSVGSGCYFNAAEVNEAVRTLSRANAKPIGGRFICIIHPDNKKDLFDDTSIINAFTYALQGPAMPLFTGVLGDWMGVRFVETTNLKVNSSYGMSGADVYEVYLIGQEAYAVTELDALQTKTIIHLRGSGGHGDPLDQHSTVGWKAAMAAKVLNANWGVKLYCASSRTPAA